MDILQEVRRVFDVELEQLKITESELDESIVDVVKIVHECQGKVVLCGMGKPGHIAKKISATMSSLGIPSYYLHPAEAQHGDLGLLSKEDVIIFISNSGETSEVCKILPTVRLIGLEMIAITSHAESTLGKYADHVIKLPDIKEASASGLAPTSSTTAELVIGDAIAVVASKLKGFSKDDFAVYHPAGSIGQKLTTYVKDLMAEGDDLPKIKPDSTMFEAIEIMCKTGLGGVVVVDEKDSIMGLVTDGDLKRYLLENNDIHSKLVGEMMTKTPVCVYEDMLAVDALKIMEKREKQLSILPVINRDEKVVGLLRTHDILRRGIFI